MRKDFLLFLSFLVDAGYIVSFRVTKYIYLITAEVIAAARLVLVPSKGNRRNGIAGAVREERPPQVKVH